VLVLDSGGLSLLAKRTQKSAAMIAALRDEGQWPPLVPTVVLIESLHGNAGRDANTNRFLKACLIDQAVPTPLARRAARLRKLAGKGSAVDAIVVALAEPNGTVMTADRDDIEALAAHADRVDVVAI